MSIGPFPITVLSLALVSGVHSLAGGEPSFSVGAWPESPLGNHRAVLRVTQKADAVCVRIPWRRRDHHPEKAIVLVDAVTEKTIRNVLPLEVNREFGEFAFQPQTAPGSYYLYYLPYVKTGSSYPKGAYPDFERTAEPAWLERNGLSAPASLETVRKALPEAEVTTIQAIDAFNSFYPMEVIATAAEIAALLAKHPEPCLLFPEDREYSIRMRDDLPQRWIESGPRDWFGGEALRGEFYVFQIGVWAARQTIEDLNVQFSPMRERDGKTVLPASGFRCFNTGGVGWDGKPFRKTCGVEQGKVRALWMGVQVPRDVPPGKYEGELTVTPKGMASSPVRLYLQVGEGVLADCGDSDPGRLSRLRWLDSRIAFDDEVVAPFTPLELDGNTVRCLGRSVAVGRGGFPARVQSWFSREVTHLEDKGRDVLTGPISFELETPDGNLLLLEGKMPAFTSRAPGLVTWESESTAGPVSLRCRGRMEFDGHLEFEVRVGASKTTELRDVRLQIPVSRAAAKYMMGMEQKGGRRPAQFEWKWDQTKNHDALWVGDTHAGVYCSFRDERYARPLNTNFYLSSPLVMPRSWCNEGKGGCTIRETGGDTVLITAFSGSRTIREGEELFYNFILMVTPFKTLDTQGQWSTRYSHDFKPADEVAAAGANTINNHHASAINPFINYPFLRVGEMKKYIDEAHQKGLKVKIYNTIRELSNHAPELFALRSLDDEVFLRGPGGGYGWLQEHLGSDYIPAWFVPQYQDAAILDSGMSRWQNYYLEGVNWLVKNVGIDGLYIDDLAFDRTGMKRLRKILDRGRKGALIDVHSANQFNKNDGFVNCALLYLEHFPYINRLWFGEYFQYNQESPDFWLVEVSGIPFGLMGEMLQDGGNPWRGMVYGMTARYPWNKMPPRIWKVWDAFGIREAEMLGYWSPSCPVRTGREDVMATAYVKKGKTMIALASWAKEAADCRLKIDWAAVGLNPAKAVLTAPAIEEFQKAASFKPDDAIRMEPGKGWLLILEEREGRIGDER